MLAGMTFGTVIADEVRELGRGGITLMGSAGPEEKSVFIVNAMGRHRA